jgi:hypothetical protein
MAFTLVRSANFGKSRTGLATVGYTLIGTPSGQARTTTGVSEIPGTGIYSATVTFPDGFAGVIEWDTGDVNPRYAAETVNVNAAIQETVTESSIALIAPSDVIQAIPRLATLADLQDLIYDVSAAVITHVGQSFGLATYTETHNGADRSRIWLRNLPIVSVTSVTVEGTAIDNTNGDGWTVNPATGELRRGSGQQDQQFEAWFPTGLQNIVVVYTAGAGVPREVRRAAILTVKHWVDATKNTGVFESEDLGDYSYTLSGVQVKLPAIAEQLLAPYILDFIV